MATENLREYLNTHQCVGFSATPHYFPREDFLTYFFQNDRCYSERVDDVLTVYLAMDTKDVVGVKIKGARHLVEMAGNFEVTVEDDDGIRLGFFFFIGAALAKGESQKKFYSDLGRFKNLKVEIPLIHEPTSD